MNPLKDFRDLIINSTVKIIYFTSKTISYQLSYKKNGRQFRYAFNINVDTNREYHTFEEPAYYHVDNIKYAVDNMQLNIIFAEEPNFDYNLEFFADGTRRKSLHFHKLITEDEFLGKNGKIFEIQLRGEKENHFPEGTLSHGLIRHSFYSNLPLRVLETTKSDIENIKTYKVKIRDSDINPSSTFPKELFNTGGLFYHLS